MMNTAGSVRQPDRPLWRNFSFTLMWTSTAASGFGDRMIMLAALALLGGLAEDIDNSSAIQAGTQFWFFLAYIFFSIPAGWLADRLPRKWMMFACDEIRGLLLLASFFLIVMAEGHPAHIPSEHHWKVYTILFAIGIFAAIFNPTRAAIIPQIVELRHLQPANAIIFGINIIASLVGMQIGKLIIDPDSATSVRTGLITAALFYMISGTFFAFLRLRRKAQAVADQAHPAEARSLLQAARYVLAHRRLLTLIILNIFVWSSAAAATSALIGIGRVHHGFAGQAALNYFTDTLTALGAGMLAGAAIIIGIRTRKESSLVLLTSFGMAGLCIFLLAAVRVQWLSYVFAFGVGMFGNIVIVSILSLLQSMCPDYMRGRVMGVNSMVNTIFSVATYFAIWRLPNADANMIWVLLALGPILMVIAVYGLLRHVTRGPLNDTLLNVIWRLNRLYVFVWHRLVIIGKHHLPREGGAIVAPNHTTGLDPLLLQAGCPRVIRWLMLTIYQHKWLNWFWKRIDAIALDRAEADRAKLRRLISVVADGDMICIFPEGQLQRDQRELQPFQPGISVVARRGNALIIPAYIHGTPQTRSMLWHFLRPSHSTLIFGKPYRIDPDLSDQDIADDLRNRVVALAREVGGP